MTTLGAGYRYRYDDGQDRQQQTDQRLPSGELAIWFRDTDEFPHVDILS